MDKAKKRVNLPGRIGIRLNDRAAKALRDLSEKLTARAREAREKDPHFPVPDVSISEIARAFIEQADFIETMVILGYAPSRLFIGKLLEDGLRAWMANDEKYPVISEQLQEAQLVFLFYLFIGWEKAKRKEPGHTLEKVCDKKGKLLGYRVHYVINQRIGRLPKLVEYGSPSVEHQ